MGATVMMRPVWRRFAARWMTRAAEHVRAGGHAVIEREDEKLDLLLPTDETGKITELGLWSILAIEQQRWRRVKSGPAKGLAITGVRNEYGGSVLDWCERDAAHRASRRKIKLDCLDCGACCHGSNVVLDEADFERWREAGRTDLLGKAYLKKKDGRITLRFAPDRRCQNLQSDNKCAIYAIRPDNCSVFPVGSECCLAAREDTMGWRDGLPPIPDDA